MEEEYAHPAIFIGHGSALNAFDKQGKYYKALLNFAKNNPRPDTIVVLSAHWQTDETIEITGNETQFPELPEDEENSYLKALIKSIRGNPALARSIIYSLKKKGFKSRVNTEKGIDHGAWIPVYLMYPELDIPVLQISVPLDKRPKSIFKLGLSLRAFRKEKILFIGSGNVVHNRKIRHQERDAPVSGWAKDFDAWIEEHIFGDLDELFDYENLAPNSSYAAPTPEHLSPLFFVLGLKYDFEKIKTIYEGFEHSTTSMRSFCFEMK